jgi:hypothetical protein
MGTHVGGRVGYIVGGGESMVSPQTRVTFVTDGLQLVRELVGGNRAQILVIDEVHEWNEHLEILVAWARMHLRDGADFRLVLMSATLEADRLAAWFDGAPIIRVPGRLFPIEERPRGESPITDTAALLRDGRNVLLFQPGKAEIEDACRRLEAAGLDAEIIQLHGSLTPQEQARAFQHYGRPKCVIATNVAQTSITIDDIDAVVDTGTERRIEIDRGVEGLMLRPLSLADREQRKGRAGRTRPGIYIDHCPIQPDARRPFPVAEIQRVRLDRAMLRLAEAGVDLRQMELFHAPDGDALLRATESLEVLGLMDANGITQKGRRVARLPVSPSCGCMLLEAAARGVLPRLLTAAAIIEAGGILLPPSPSRAPWHKGVTCRDSDVLAQAELYDRVRAMPRGGREAAGVASRAYDRASETRSALERALEGKVRNTKCVGDPGVEARKALAAGMLDSLWGSRNDGRTYTSSGEDTREIGRRSIVHGEPWVIAVPLNLGNRQLLEDVTAVDPMWLSEIAPHLTSVEVGAEPRFDGQLDCCTALERTTFRGQVIKEQHVSTPDHPEAARLLAECLARKCNTSWFGDDFQVPPGLEVVIEHNKAVTSLDGVYFSRTGEHLSFWDGSRHNVTVFTEWLKERLDAQGARRMAQITDTEALRFPFSMEEQAAQAVIARRPDKVEVLGLERKINWTAGKAHLEHPLLEGEICQMRGDVLVDGVPLQSRDWTWRFETIKSRWESHLNRVRMDAAGKLCLPEIPDPAHENDVDLFTFDFSCPLTGETLQMSGCAEWEPRSWSSNGGWRAHWSLDDPDEILDIAEQSRTHLREIARERASQEERRLEIERTRQQQRDLQQEMERARLREKELEDASDAVQKQRARTAWAQFLEHENKDVAPSASLNMDALRGRFNKRR